jgi:hypothetical protein
MNIIESDIRGSIEPFTMITTGSDSRSSTTPPPTTKTKTGSNHKGFTKSLTIMKTDSVSGDSTETSTITDTGSGIRGST